MQALLLRVIVAVLIVSSFMAIEVRYIKTSRVLNMHKYGVRYNLHKFMYTIANPHATTRGRSVLVLVTYIFFAVIDFYCVFWTN
jgi:hypothetical protein